jgi:glutamate mutase epsilon subunit
MSKALTKTGGLESNGSSIVSENQIQKIKEIQNFENFENVDTPNCKEKSGTKVVITRKFRLNDIDIPATMFEAYDLRVRNAKITTYGIELLKSLHSTLDKHFMSN